MFNTKKHYITLLGTLAAAFCALISSGGAAFAQTSGSFSVQAVIPENQVDKRQTYFDLRMQPGDEQTVEVIINNSLDTELVAQVRLNAASTGRNGLIVYTEPDVRDEIMRFSATDVASVVSDIVTVPARSSKAVAVDIKMPDESIDGVILGGIVVSEDGDGHSGQAAGGVSLNNKITYVLALKLTGSDMEEEPDFVLASIKPELVNFKTAVVVTLQNKAAHIVKDMEVKAQVFSKGSDAPLRELELSGSEMAPLSSGEFVVDWNNRPLDSGIYRLKMTVSYSGRTWEWDEEFTIGTEADGLNREAVGLVKDYTWLYVLLGLAGLIVVFVLAYLLGKRSREKGDSQE